MKKQITESMGLQKEWEETAKNIKTSEQLIEFIHHLLEDYIHDYGTIVHAMSAAMKATFYCMRNSDQGGITGFQASCLGWEMINEFFGKADGGRRLVDYDGLLFPQYADVFTSIPKSVAEWIKNEAAKKLKENNVPASPRVVAHWQRIAAGEIPFGLTIE